LLYSEQYGAAEQAFSQAIDLDPSYSWNYYGLALAYEYAGRFDEAGVALENASANSFDDPWLEDAIGWEFIELGRCDLAIVHFERALEIDPSMGESQDGIDFCSG
jgi:tetratricopeptide (TPR) repeat protein